MDGWMDGWMNRRKEGRNERGKNDAWMEQARYYRQMYEQIDKHS